MGFESLDFKKTYNDPRQFPSHKEVHDYLLDYSSDLRDFISLNE